MLAHAVNHQTLPALPLLPPVLADAAAVALLAVAPAPAVRADARAAALLAVVPQPVMLANAAAVALLASAPLSAVLADTGQVLTRLWLLDARALQLLSQLLLGGCCRRVCLGLMLWVLLLGLQRAGLRRRLGHGSVFVGAGRRCRRTVHCKMLHFSIYVFLTLKR